MKATARWRHDSGNANPPKAKNRTFSNPCNMKSIIKLFLIASAIMCFSESLLGQVLPHSSLMNLSKVLSQNCKHMDNSTGNRNYFISSLDDKLYPLSRGNFVTLMLLLENLDIREDVQDLYFKGSLKAFAQYTSTNGIIDLMEQYWFKLGLPASDCREISNYVRIKYLPEFKRDIEKQRQITQQQEEERERQIAIQKEEEKELLRIKKEQEYSAALAFKVLQKQIRSKTYKISEFDQSFTSNAQKQILEYLKKEIPNCYLNTKCKFQIVFKVDTSGENLTDVKTECNYQLPFNIQKVRTLIEIPICKTQNVLVDADEIIDGKWEITFKENFEVVVTKNKVKFPRKLTFSTSQKNYLLTKLLNQVPGRYQVNAIFGLASVGVENNNIENVVVKQLSKKVSSGDSLLSFLTWWRNL